MMKPWTLYIIECRDSSLYTGITTDLEKRLKRHNEGRASAYTRSRTPVKFLYRKDFLSESQARKKEAEIKKLSRYEKLRFLKSERIVSLAVRSKKVTARD